MDADEKDDDISDQQPQLQISNDPVLQEEEGEPIKVTIKRTGILGSQSRAVN
jgi:hypothetical protein